MMRWWRNYRGARQFSPAATSVPTTGDMRGTGDYANQIEPGVAGGRKIAAGIFNLVQIHDFSSGRTAVYR